MLNADQPIGPLRFQSYQTGKIVINQHTYDQNVLLSQHAIIASEVIGLKDLSSAHLQSWVDQYQSEIVLIGTGVEHLWLDLVVFDKQKRPLSIEYMTTENCLRTFVALQSEPRDLLCYLAVR